MNPISFADFLKIPIHKDPHVSKFDENGNKVLARYYQATGAVHVHPDHWEEFLWKMDEVANAIPDDESK
jgi:spore maturation protein CgeB